MRNELRIIGLLIRINGLPATKREEIMKYASRLLKQSMGCQKENRIIIDKPRKNKNEKKQK